MSSTEFWLSTEKPVCRHVDGDDAGMSPANDLVSYTVSQTDWQSIKLTDYIS
ncbi:hypothetical protein [Planococcus faecalis]|nr:hypothetical protein [Planococcus faecalis]